MEFDKDKLKWLEFNLFKPYPHVVHGCFARHGGSSTGPFATLNVGIDAGDHPDAVKVNRERIRQTLGLTGLVFPCQTHGVGIVRISEANRNQTHQADALFTTDKKIGLAIGHADCQAALFYDPVHKAVAAVHAGWRGSVQNIYAKVITTLHETLGTDPKQLLVCISPSLGPDHAEFKDYEKDFPRDFWDFQVTPFHFNFWAISRRQLLECGVLAQHIEMAEICTACSTKDYFSYRAERKTGRNATVISLC